MTPESSRTKRPLSPPSTPSEQQKAELSKEERKDEKEMELELPSSPPPVELTLAERRAKRQAIIAKYAGSASISASQGASPSPGPSSAVEPPPPVATVSDPVSRTHSVTGTPGPLADLQREVTATDVNGSGKLYGSAKDI